MAPSTFASAAASNSHAQNPSRDATLDWSRRTNGATQTFRRPSGATTTPTPAALNDISGHNPPRYVPPHRNGIAVDTRYTKEQLLDLFKMQQSADNGLNDDLQSIFLGGWQLEIANGGSAGWGRTEANREGQPGPDICWEKDGTVEPLGLLEMDDEERELFSTSVNTPIKPPATNKENQQPNGITSRKVSVSNAATTPGGFGLPSPSAARGGVRRREASESYPFPSNAGTSPGGPSRDESRAASPPPSLLRRRTDLKDVSKPEDKDADDKLPNAFGSLKRHPTGPLNTSFAAPASPWASGPQSAGLSPMGSFGNFGLGGSAVGSQGSNLDKRAAFGAGRAESRFKNLLQKDASDERMIEQKPSTSSLAKVAENQSWRGRDHSEHADDSQDEGDEALLTGSAALAADADVSPSQPRPGYRGFGTPSRQGTQDDYGFGAFGMTTDTTHPFGQSFLPNRDTFQHTPSHQRMGQAGLGGHEPMSPTDTNPYQSPDQRGADRNGEDLDSDQSDLQSSHLPALRGFNTDAQQLSGLGGLGTLPNLGRAPNAAQAAASDRSQTSSVAGTRGFPLNGLSGLGAPSAASAWPSSQGGLGTPVRQAANVAGPFGSGLGNGLFSNTMSDMQSPALAGLGAGSLLGQPGGSFTGSRLSNMFPAAMQDQMRQQQEDRDASRDRSNAHLFGNLGDGPRGPESPFTNPGFLNESRSASSQQDHQAGEASSGHFGAPGKIGGLLDTATGQGQSSHALPSNSVSQPPPPQQRTMVMPDRMRWIYCDPQGQTQGPWSGLEMHDWYKAGFFSPELLVRKHEDPDYEPLAQLIRRIGNSREPFLVPQIGIPHGPPSNNGPNAWAGPSTLGGPAAGAGPAQPPFASSFPSFGTTLTADQQNALERRKQEEQYLMARQKEHLAQAQIAQRMQMGGAHPSLLPGQLHHHSSAHSLQSQPSFGSMTSPAGYQPSPIQGPGSSTGPGLFDNSFRQPQAGGLGAVGAGMGALGHIREETVPGLMDRLNIGGGPRAQPNQFGAPGQPFGSQNPAQHPSGPDAHNQQVQQMLQDRARLQQEQAQHNAMQPAEEVQPTSNERLQQFHQLQGQPLGSDVETRLQADKSKSSSVNQQSSSFPDATTPASVSQGQQQQQSQEPLSLREQVQKAAAKQTAASSQQLGNLPQPFPPAPSQSPLPAPDPQRKGRQTVADQLQNESRDRSQTPSVEASTTAPAPWANQPNEVSKGPSLKEIQEAEAKKAAEAEELAAAARRAAFQKEMEAQAAAAAATQSGLPAGSTWATAGSVASSPATGSAPAAWAKTVQKAAGPTIAKSMAQIQKEEEARKKKIAAAALSAQANALTAVAATASGKSYANLAGKVAAPAPSPVSGSWTTVGAGGKAKTPSVPASTPAGRAVSASIVPTIASTASPAVASASATRKAPVRSTSGMTMNSTVNAQEEFKKWAINELRPDLNKTISSADDFVATLVFLPPDMDIITEAVHSASTSIDSRHFAEEFIRRKKLADKGLFDPSSVLAPSKSSSSPHGGADNKSGGWSEVAKKGPSSASRDAVGASVGAGGKEDPASNFRVVAAKKKSGKR